MPITFLGLPKGDSSIGVGLLYSWIRHIEILSRIMILSHDIFQEEVVEFFEKAKSKGAYTVLCNRESPDGFFKSRQRDNEMKMFPVAYTVG